MNFWRKLTRLPRREELARRLREELEFHAAMKARESGQTPAEVRRAIGYPARILEDAADVWSLPRLEHAWADLRHAARSLAKSPAFFLLAAIGTALGVAALTSVASVAGPTLVRPLPYRDSGRLVVVSDQLLKIGFPRFPISVANYLDYRARNRVFEDIAAFEPRALTAVVGDRAERVPGMAASSNLLPLLGGAMTLGHWFEPPDNHQGRLNIVVLSHAFWRSRLDSDPAVIGKLIRIDDTPCAVVGVLREGFGFRLSGVAPELWLPAALDPDPARAAGALQSIARLKPGVPAAEANAQMQVIAADLKRRYRTQMGPHGEDAGYTVTVVPLREELYGPVRPTLYALAGAAGILLLLGLANTALLWLGRAAARRREAAVRLALGASRARVGQQFVIEALWPALTGGALALVLTLAALRAFNAARFAELATVDRFAVDYRVFGFTLLLSAACGILCGALPVRSLFRPGAEGGVLAQDRGSIAGRRDGRARPVLIAVQVGLSCALLPPSLLLVQSLSALERVDPGFRTADLLTAYVTLPSARYRAPVEITGYYQRLEQALGAWRGAANVALASRLPLGFGTGGDPFSIEGRAWGASGALPQFAHRVLVSPRYFSLLRITVVSGRTFDAHEFAGSAEVAIVNQTLARAFWPRESPVGKRIVIGAPRPGVAWMTIVGVVADVRTEDLSRAPLPQIYRPFPQSPTPTMALIVGGPGGAAGLAADLARVLKTADPGVPAYAAGTMQQHVAETLERPRFRTTLFTAYGLLAFALSAFGIYSMAVYSAILRRREFALRAALGASPRRMLLGMLAGTLKPAALGATTGLAAAFSIARAMRTLLYTASASNPQVYWMAGLLALTVAALAAWLGSRRELAVDPAEVLRAD